MSSRRIFSIHAAILAVALLLVSASSSSSKYCVYTLYVEPAASVTNAGTDSKMSAALGDSSKGSVWIRNMKARDVKGHKHDYNAERGNPDIYSGIGPCVGATICKINVEEC